MSDTSTVKWAVPKGSLQKDVAALLRGAGFDIGDYGDSEKRNYRPDFQIPGLEVKVLRPQEIPMMTARGNYDIGISGYDWWLETGCERNVELALDLGIGRVDIVLAVPEAWKEINSAAELFARFRDSAPQGGMRIWTEYLNLAEDLVLEYDDTEPSIVSPHQRVSRQRHSGVTIFHSFGATEAKPPEDGDAIVDNTATGSTLRSNDLKIIHNVVTGSTAHLLVNKRSMRSDARRRIIEGVIEKLGTVAVKPHARRLPAAGHIEW